MRLCSQTNASRPAALLRVAGFVLLILGIPVLIFLPEAFQMPSWWERTIEIVLLAGVTILGFVFAFACTWLLCQPIRYWRKAIRRSSWLDIGKFLFLLYLLGFLWFAVISGAIELIQII